MDVLITPVLDSIDTFDARGTKTVTFTVPEGNQATQNNLTIRRVDSNEKVYDVIQETFDAKHVVPANTLRNGVNYKAEVRVGDINGIWSDYSPTVFFWSYSAPVIRINNIDYDNQNRVYEQNPLFVATYSQAENNPLQSYRYRLYDGNKDLIKVYNEKFTSNKNDLRQEVAGLENDKNYHIEVTTTSANGGVGSSGKIPITPYYDRPTLDGVITGQVIEDEGAIRVLVDMAATPINTEKIKIQRRVDSGWEWEDIVELPYTQGVVEYLDKYVANGEDYIYSVLPVVAGVDGVRETSQVYRAVFDGVFISDLNSNYSLLYNLEQGEIDNNIASGVFTPLSSQFPIVVSSGLDYGTFSVTALFVKPETIEKGLDTVNVQEEKKARDGLMRFLKNGRPKVYRDVHGELMIVSVTGNVREAPHRNRAGLSTITVNLTEIGGVNSETLISNNLRERVKRG